MFSGGAKIGAEFANGDNCAFIPRSSIPEEPSAKYMINGEIPFVFMKSLKEDHIFTDQAYISIEGKSVNGQKRFVTRYNFFATPITNVYFETSGTGLDTDCELKFAIGGQLISIDIKKAEVASGIQLYRALTALAMYQTRNNSMFEAVKSSINNKNIHLTVNKDDKELVTTMAALNASGVSEVVNLYNQFIPISYQHILNQYLG